MQIKNKIIVLLCLGWCNYLCAQDSLQIHFDDGSTQKYALVNNNSLLKGQHILFFQHNPKQKAVEKNYRNNKLNGILKYYYPDGKLMEFGIYGNGLKHGEWTKYNQKGEIEIKGSYRNDVKHGYWTFKKERCSGRYKNGVKNGYWTCYTENEIIRTRYVKGKEEKVKIIKLPGT